MPPTTRASCPIAKRCWRHGTYWRGPRRSNWSVSTPIDLWEGITVAGSPPRVYGLKLAGKELTGEIPPGLGSLSNLEELILIENHLTGRIPTELGGLANLILLNLYGNQLSGEIPTELATLSNLRELSLSSNQLTGQIPTRTGRPLQPACPVLI